MQRFIKFGFILLTLVILCSTIAMYVNGESRTYISGTVALVSFACSLALFKLRSKYKNKL